MINKSDLLKEISDKERDSGLYEQKVKGIAFWRIVRLPIIRNYLLCKYEIGKGDIRATKNSVKKYSILDLLNTTHASVKKIAATLFFEKKCVDSVILAFPRLQEVERKYMDKFTDPLVEFTDISKSYLVFQRHHSGRHYPRRYNDSNVIKTDAISFLSRILGLIYLPVTLVIYLFPMLKLYLIARKEFDLSISNFASFFLKLSELIATKNIYKFIFKKLKVKQVFLVNREVFHPEILACKELGINSYEIQHGVTHGWTLLYSGLYNENIDVDCFLSFGCNWNGKQFGLPVDKIANVGWAYKDFVMEKLGKVEKLDAVLIISDSIANMISLLENISSRFCDVDFHIRPHPNEFISEQLLIRINSMNNMTLLDNKIESTVVLNSYKKLVGVSSSVLFEALSLNIKVGVFNMEGCATTIPMGKFIGAFESLNTLDDFEVFISSSLFNNLNASQYYGDFRGDKINAMLR